MSQFRIRGIDYTDEDLQHGLGIGGGRGRPKGSKNGQIMPGAAYMQKYKIVGEKAEGTTNLPGAQNTNRRLAGPVNRNLQRDYRRAIQRQPSSGNMTQQTRSASKPTPEQQRSWSDRTARMVRSNSNQRGTIVSQPSEIHSRSLIGGNTGTTTAASKVEKGKNVVNSMTGGTTDSTTRNRNMSTAELRAQDPVGDWPWSARRVNAAGGLKSREGRQIVYDNPTLNEDYKKQIAKRYGDSDGKSYPREYDRTASTEKEPSVSPERQFANELLGATPANMNSGRLNLIQPVNPNAARPSRSTNNTNSTGNTTPEGGTSGNQPENQPGNATPESVVSENQPGNVNPEGGTSGSQPGNTQQAQTQPGNTQQEQTPAASKQREETPEQKSLWDSVGSWFAQAGKDIGNTVVGALNAAGSAVSDAANWVGDRLREGGEWALASMGDVGEWIGDRAKDIDAWWNGRDVEVNDNGRDRQAHQTGAREAIEDWWNGRDTVGIQNGVYRRNHEAGARENIGNALNTAGQWIGNAAGDVGRAVGGAANSAGQWIGNAAGDVGRTVGNAANAAGQWIGNAAGDVGRAVGGAVNDAGQWIGNAAGDVGRAANAAGQWIGNAAGDVGRAVGDAAGHVGGWVGQRAQDVSNFVNGVQPGTPAAAPYLDLGTGQWVYPEPTPSLGERIGNAAGDVGQWVGDTATNAWNGVAGATNDAGQAIDQWWNGDNSSSRSPLAQPLFSNPVSEWFNGNVINPVFGGILPNSNANTNNGGARGWINNNIVAPVSNAANGVGNFVRDTANNVGQGASNLAGNVGQTVANAYNQVTGNTMENADNATARALNAGIPADYVGQLRDQLTLGLINPAQYVQQINNLLDNPNMTDPDRR